jgi:hypothetical protein
VPLTIATPVSHIAVGTMFQPLLLQPLSQLLQTNIAATVHVERVQEQPDLRLCPRSHPHSAQATLEFVSRDVSVLVQIESLEQIR